MGIFLANATVREASYSDAHVHWWSASKQGYLPARMFGYAMALFAWLREERKPDWGQHLRKDARGAFDDGRKFLQNTGDAGCLSSSGRDGREHVSPHSRLALLNGSESGAPLEALWKLRCPDEPELNTDEWQAVMDGLSHDERIVRCETAHTIAALNRCDEELAERLHDTLRRHHGDVELRAAVALAFGSQREPLDLLLDELDVLIGDPSPTVAIAALAALKNFPTDSVSALLPSVMQRFQKALLSCDSLLVAQTVDTLRAVSVSPKQEVGKFFADDDELRQQAYAALSMDIDERALSSIRLPTAASIPVPIPGWRQSIMHDPQPPNPNIF